MSTEVILLSVIILLVIGNYAFNFMKKDHNKDGKQNFDDVVSGFSEKAGEIEKEVKSVSSNLETKFRDLISEFRGEFADLKTDSEKKMEELKAQFRGEVRELKEKLDANNDGKINVEDLKALLKETVDKNTD